MMNDLYDNYDSDGRNIEESQINNKDAQIIYENTNTKIFLKVEESEELDCFDNIYGSKL